MQHAYHRKISVLLLTKAIIQFTFFFLVTIMFNKKISLKFKNFPSLKKKFLL